MTTPLMLMTTGLFVGVTLVVRMDSVDEYVHYSFLVHLFINVPGRSVKTGRMAVSIVCVFGAFL